MGKFCTQCGAAATNGRFCVRCGSLIDNGPAAPAARPPVPSAGLPPASKPGSGLKIALIVIALIAVLGMGSVIGLFYYAKSRVHAKLAELKAQTGIDLPAAIQSANEPQRLGGKRDGCLLLTRSEAEGILGFALVRSDGTLRDNSPGEHCDYYADSAALRQARKDTAARFQALINSKSAPQGGSAQMEDLVKGMVGGVNNGSAPILQITIYRGDASSMLGSYRVGTTLMGSKMESVPGPWDEAVFGPMNSTLAVRKGQNGVMIDLRQIPQGRDKGLAIARTITPRL